ncbi:MAG: hypothetical protein LBE35_09355, partial [Clostridiales bacterium]|nr:hypothetical protein [Clostridiales bacterium]
LWAWGWHIPNLQGSGGHITNMAHLYPVHLMDNVAHVNFVPGVLGHTIITTTDGEILSFGNDAFGRLIDDAEFSEQNHPFTIDENGILRDIAQGAPILENVVDFSSLNGRHLAITSDGAVWSWGRYLTGIFINRTIGSEIRENPVKILDSDGFRPDYAPLISRWRLNITTNPELAQYSANPQRNVFDLVFFNDGTLRAESRGDWATIDGVYGSSIRSYEVLPWEFGENGNLIIDSRVYEITITREVNSGGPFNTMTLYREGMATQFVRGWEVEREEVLSGLAADAARVVELIEETHPIFLMPEMLPETYEDARANLLAISPDDTRQEFIFALRRYITTLRDGHMNLWHISGNFLSVEWEARNIDGRFDLILQDSGASVAEIGGIPIDEIFATIDRYFYSENSVERLRSYAIFARYGAFLERAGVDITDLPIRIIDENGARRYALLNIRPEQIFPPRPPREFIIRHEMIGDVFFIDLRAFIDGEHITEVVEAIEAAIDEGIRKFIVDLRGNSGGNSAAGSRLLYAMDISVPYGSGFRRQSPLAEAQRTNDWQDGIVRWEHNLEAAANPNDVFISVLTDNYTYSSGVMFAYWVQDGGFGNIVGAPSRGSPSGFGDMLGYTLPYSNIQLAISYTYFSRPDANADQLYLWPDILIDPADALEAALEYLTRHSRESGNPL